ncbi:MAG: rod shape-determining protein [Pseudomonadaceae bacterium]
MILNMVRKLFSGTVYVRISEDRLRVHHLENGSVFDQPPLIAIDASNPRKVTLRAIGDEAQGLEAQSGVTVSNPFSHPRLLVSNFRNAEWVLRHAIRAVHPAQFVTPSPVVIMHPLEKLEGGLTDIECRVFRELALGAGARQVHLHVGEALSPNHFTWDQIRSPDEQ